MSWTTTTRTAAEELGLPGQELFHMFVRINLEPKIQIKYVYTKNQLADMMS